jgi:hypothetical protein
MSDIWPSASCGLDDLSTSPTYLYFFYLGQKNGGVATCREPYAPADRLEDQVVKLYQRLQLPEAVVDSSSLTCRPRSWPAKAATPQSASSRLAS